MSPTIPTTESFSAGTSVERIKEERKLRIDAGAFSSEYEGSETTGWTLTTKWVVMRGCC